MESIGRCLTSQAEAYGWIAKLQAKAGDFAEALKTISLISESQSALSAKDDALLQVAVQQSVRDSTGAKKTIEQIQSSKTKDRAKHFAAEYQAKAGDFAGAIGTAESIQEEPSREFALGNIGSIQVRAGDLAGAINTATLIQNGGDLGAVLGSVSMALARKGDFAGALKYASLSEPRSNSNLTQSQIAIAEIQVENGDFAGALKTAAMVADEEQTTSAKSIVQASIAEAKLKSGDTDGARKTLMLAHQSAVLAGYHKYSALHKIAIIQAQCGDVAGALVLAGDFQDPDQSIIILISEIQARSGDVVGALRTANLIRSKDYKGDAQRKIAQVQAEGGDATGAIRTADLIQSEYTKGYALSTIAGFQVERGDLAGAQKTVSLIQDTTTQNAAQEVLDQARLKQGDLVTLWLQKLNDSNHDHDAALNTMPFLDLQNHMRSLSSSADPKKFFEALYRTLIDMIDAQKVITRILKRQTAQLSTQNN